MDTNVLIQSPYALECFEDNEIVLPMAVVEELDKRKAQEGDEGANIRKVIRQLEKLRQRGDLLKGVPLKEGGLLRIEKNYMDVRLPEDLSVEAMGNRILKICLGLAEETKKQVTLFRCLHPKIGYSIGINGNDRKLYNYETENVIDEKITLREQLRDTAQIVVIEDGRIVQRGRHEELIAS